MSVYYPVLLFFPLSKSTESAYGAKAANEKKYLSRFEVNMGMVLLEINISGFGLVKLEYLVSDFTGSLSLDGALLPNIRQELNELSQFLKIIVLTADTFGTARSELKGIVARFIS